MKYRVSLILFFAILSLPAFAAEPLCSVHYTALDRFVLKGVHEEHLNAILQALPEEKREPVLEMITNLPEQSTLPAWLKASQRKVFFWRPKQVAEVLEVFTRSEEEWDILLAKAFQHPMEISFPERRAVLLRIANKWWFNEHIEFTRKLGARISRIRPSQYLAANRLPFEDFLHNRNEPGFWKALFRVQASTREVAKVMEESEGEELLRKFMELRQREVEKALESAKGLTKLQLEYELSRLNLLEKLLGKTQEEWKEEIRKNPGLKRSLLEIMPAGLRGVEDMAAYLLVFAAISKGLEMHADKYQEVQVLPESRAEVKKRESSTTEDDPAAQALRDYNDGKITQKELKRKAPQLFQ